MRISIVLSSWLTTSWADQMLIVFYFDLITSLTRQSLFGSRGGLARYASTEIRTGPRPHLLSTGPLLKLCDFIFMEKKSRSPNAISALKFESSNLNQHTTLTRPLRESSTYSTWCVCEHLYEKWIVSS
jgi:hypothetical protein